LAPGVLYHVIVRGNQRQKSFFDDSESVQAIRPDRGRDGGAALVGIDNGASKTNRESKEKIKVEGGKRKDERSVGKTSCG
jgi:hypothetical protein